MDRVRVSVPASSANLGPGYDCLGVALPLRNVVDVTLREGPLEVAVGGAGAGELPADAGNLVVQSFAAVWPGPLDGLRFDLHNEIPLRCGTGSSSAAIVGGLAAGLALAGRPHDPAELLAHAAEIEGHPDNVAAAIWGGFTVAIGGDEALGDGPLARRIEPPLGLAFVLCVPDDTLCTRESRQALRADLPRADAVHSLQRSALLVELLCSGRVDLLGRALDDRMHEPDRARLAPLLGRLRARAASLDALGATLSGAGPSVLVWLHAGRGQAAAAAIAAAEPAVSTHVLAPEPRGVEIEHL